jgi:Fe-S cluster assembly scaffold protein SufB
LLEENIVFGKNVSVKTLPGLSVASHAVQASHGAKIEKINAEKLFYMSSKGLTDRQAQTLVVDGYVNAILSHFDQFSEKELETVRKMVTLKS